MALNVADPELERQWLDEAKARGVSIDVLLGEALAAYRLTAEWRKQAEETDRFLEGQASMTESQPLGAPDGVEAEFRALAERWRAETGHLSSIERKAMHPSYQRIVALGSAAVPFVLRELAERGGHWFWALHRMTGVDLSQPDDTVRQLRERWLAWGRERGYLG